LKSGNRHSFRYLAYVCFRTIADIRVGL